MTLYDRVLHAPPRGRQKPSQPGQAGNPQPKTATRQRQHRLTADQTAELAVAYQAGATVRELAVLYKVNRTTVLSILERAGVPRRWRKLSPADIEQADQLYAAGLSLAKVGAQLGVHGNTVLYALHGAGVKLRDPHGYTAADRVHGSGTRRR